MVSPTSSLLWTLLNYFLFPVYNGTDPLFSWTGSYLATMAESNEGDTETILSIC